VQPPYENNNLALQGEVVDSSVPVYSPWLFRDPEKFPAPVKMFPDSFSVVVRGEKGVLNIFPGPWTCSTKSLYPASMKAVPKHGKFAVKKREAAGKPNANRAAI
jgi:hypothetical protein